MMQSASETVNRSETHQSLSAQTKTNNLQLFLSEQRIDVESHICPLVSVSVCECASVHIMCEGKVRQKTQSSDWLRWVNMHSIQSFKSVVLVHVFCPEVKMSLELFSCRIRSCNASSCYYLPPPSVCVFVCVCVRRQCVWQKL